VKASKALYATLGLGAGEIIGALAFGKITDKLSKRMMVMINLLTLTLAFAWLFTYRVIQDYQWHWAILLTFFWGVQDAGIRIIGNNLCGF